MIVCMKKVSVIIKSLWQDEVLNSLGAIGVVHLTPVNQSKNVKIEELKDKIALLEKSLFLISDTLKRERKGAEVSDSEFEKDGLSLAKELFACVDKIKQLEDKIKQLELEYDRLRVWGEFNPEDINTLKGSGLTIRFFRCRQKELKNIREGLNIHIISIRGSTLFIAVISDKDNINIPLQEVRIPTCDIGKIKIMLDDYKNRLNNIKKRRNELFRQTSLIKKTLACFQDILSYEEARAGMGRKDDISYLVGFCPESEIQSLKIIAEKKEWAILIGEPADDDTVPTLMKHSKWTVLFRPVMNFIGVIPGYREYDTNALFLIFFSIFFALLVGDGGYGIVMLIMTFLVKKFYKQTSKELILLFYFLSGTTILWGAVTGNWFGVEALSHLPVLKQTVIP